MTGQGFLDAQALGKLKWRCRRGMLENDLLLERFFRQHETRLTPRHAQALMRLMDLSDNDLLDILLGRKPVTDAPDADGMQQLLAMLRPPSLPPAHAPHQA